jgi:hypothetical protein
MTEEVHHEDKTQYPHHYFVGFDANPHQLLHTKGNRDTRANRTLNILDHH